MTDAEIAAGLRVSPEMAFLIVNTAQLAFLIVNTVELAFLIVDT